MRTSVLLLLDDCLGGYNTEDLHAHWFSPWCKQQSLRMARLRQ